MSDSSNEKSGEILMTLRDKDIFPDSSDPTDMIWKDRRTGKVVLFDGDGRIALIGNKVSSFFMLPGGGIEEDESLIDGIRRECKEETGCEIEIQDFLGATEDFRLRESKHCISFGYSAKVVSCGKPTLTKNETDIGVYVKWLSLSEAIGLLASQEQKVNAGEVKFYNTCFNAIRDSLFVHKAYDLTNRQSIGR